MRQHSDTAFLADYIQARGLAVGGDGMTASVELDGPWQGAVCARIDNTVSAFLWWDGDARPSLWRTQPGGWFAEAVQDGHEIGENLRVPTHPENLEELAEAFVVELTRVTDEQREGQGYFGR